ncbi:serine/threonine-protein kinase [Streptomyces scabiei]|uniref:serine/threonine-protein kinase n=1 Tax=Streptomyces scabiei TaxID=1930 RepID=UPI001B30E97D|nr:MULTISPECIES: serine/threonine-protein kinase [Streptomyces]MBP5869364.1 serine/threonine protein kinase [Streptomyces sp. LBUM 1485]MBP5914699.1 serine/threonine protein kinase [Streptomyces sp. LBUM 1486]MDX3027865.1 serine/threonine-protein kinase [Streptomyces scabiei]MDX3209243.1 serine/threonine-protein kinase [Streptomyces scabiei]MDX3278729.1 serine/threonine-protein kinase [Streptomyces scabiei]
MSSNGGAPYGSGYGSDEPTSFGLQPPRPGVPYPGNPYAQPAAAVAQPTPPPSMQAPTPPPSAQAQAQSQASPPPQDPGTGRLIAGRYRLLAKLGHGGMGTVWRAQDETVDREVAVKEPRVPDHLPERERANAFERMRREARAAARLDHPSVVNVHDVAVVDGQPWIVMELVRGRSLGDTLQEGTLGVRDAARIGLDVLGALEAAHAAGILHRDVKPDNVLLGRHDRVVLTDFGIAQIEGETNLTDTGGIVGSPEYIAPERVLGQRPGPASDLWSLGVVLYAATEGVSPFRRSNTPATLQSVLNATPAAPASATGPLAEAINGLLQKDPARRPAAARVRELLETAVNPPVLAPTQEVRTVAGPPAGNPRGVRIGPKTLAGLGAVIVAAAVTAYLVVADPFAGPLPDGWKQRDLGAKVAASVGVPGDFVKDTLEPDATDGTIAQYSDPSGLIRINVDRDVKKDDKDGEIPDNALDKAYADWELVKDGEYSLDIADTPTPRGKPQEATFEGKEAAENTVRYTTTDTQAPRLREARVLYYRAGNGDVYRVWIDYPGKGHFTGQGREIARTALANLRLEHT